jgi:hypothetical protein
MNEQQDKQGGQQQGSGDSWQDVGRQFQILGESLAAALRASVNTEDNRRRMESMQSGIEAMVRDVDKAITDAAESPEAQQARQEAQRAAESLRRAGEQTAQDVRPQLLSALQQVNDELQRLIGRMGGGPPPSGDAESKTRS